MALAVLLAFVSTAPAQTDNFNYTATVPTLAAGWATSISSNYPGLLTSPSDSFGGQALRMQTSNNIPVPPQLAAFAIPQQTPRIIAWRTNQAYTNFYVAVDVVRWDTSFGEVTNTTYFDPTDPEKDHTGMTNNSYIGLIARGTNTSYHYSYNPNVPVGQPDGLTLTLDINRFGGYPQGTRGVMNIAYLTRGQPTVAGNLMQGDFTVNPGHSYRMVFTGTNILDQFGAKTNELYQGYVYDLQDLTRPLATVRTFKPTSATTWGSTVGYSGIISMAKNVPCMTDVTFDNFVATDGTLPASVTLPATPHGFANVPQVVNRVPGSWTNFYPASGGVTFTATTLTASTITNIGMSLNGVDVTSGLVITGPATSRSVTFSGLASNVVYDASIVLANDLGQKTTNHWTFDTFSDAYLASAACMNIECEDIDSNGTFIENPVASGYLFPVTYANRDNTNWPWAATATNQGPNSYVLKSAVRAASPDSGGDFWDVEVNPRTAEADYRTNGFGNSQGCGDFLYNNNSFPGIFSGSYTFDTQRKKYSDVAADLQEYFVRRNQGGDWYNYTRTFAGANYYNVYLRHGCDLTSKYQLAQMTPGGMSVPTARNALGTFYLTNAFARSNFRYARLMTPMAPPNSLIVNGNFMANASSFTNWPGYLGGSNPSSIPNWTDLFSAGGMGINGSGAGIGVGDPFGPGNSGGLTYAFIQGGDPSGGHVLGQYLTGLAPNTTYTLVYSVAGRTGNTASYRVVLYSDSAFTTSYYDSGVQPADSSGFVNVTATFTTPGTIGSAPNIQLGNWSVAGDNTVDFANVFLVPGSGPVPTSKLAVVNFSGPTTLRLLMNEPNEERTVRSSMLNYMAFVPALLVESSTQANAGYAIDSSAVVEPGTRKISIPQNGGARFYRLRWDHAATITSVKLVGGNVEMTYQ